MLRTLFVLAIFVPGFVMALRDRFAALLMYLWFAFFRPQDWIWVDVSSLRLSLVLGLVLLVPSVFAGIWPNLTHLLSIGNVLFLLTAFAAQVNAVNQEVGWIWIDYLVRLTLVCLLSVTLITTPQKLIMVLAVVGSSLGFHASKAGLFSLLGGGVRFAEGLTGTFTDNNGYALGTVMIMPLLLAVALNADRLVGTTYPKLTTWVRRGFYASLPLCAYTVVSTYSRGGFLALTAATLVYVALHRRRVRLSIAMSALIVMALTFVPIPEGYIERLETINTYEEIGEESAISRTHFWQVALAMADAKPLGIGLRNYEWTYDEYDFSRGRYGTRRAVHSAHFQVLAELGYLGTLIWIGQFVLAALVALRVRRRSYAAGLSPEDARFMISVSNCLIASMVGFLVGGAFLALMLNDLTWLTFAVLAALDRVTAQMVGARVGEPVTTSAPAPFRQWRPWRPAPVASGGAHGVMR